MGKKSITKKPRVIPAEGSPVVLFVDDEPTAIVAFERLFRGEGIKILTAPSALHAFDILKRELVHLVVSDYLLPGMLGTALLDEVARQYPNTGRMILTGVADSDMVVEAKRHQVLTKDMHPPLIRRMVLREVRRHAAR